MKLEHTQEPHNIGLDLMACLLRARRCRALAARTATAQATVNQANKHA